ncbi:hypothetical protein ACFLWS_04455 [Chloroflexota bacterium]
MYENAIYEKLLQWAYVEQEVTDFVLKGPYVGQSRLNDNGFTYDRNRQIYYYSDGETIAEFDAIFRVGQCQYFVEITNTNSESNIDTLKYEIRRKTNVLRLLFSSQVACWIITTYEKEISLEGLPGVSVLKTRKFTFDLDLRSLLKPNETEAINPPDSSKFITVGGLSYYPFSYFALLDNIQREVGGTDCDQVRQKLPDLIAPYLGLVERVFLGKMSIADFETLMKPSLKDGTEISHVYLALKVKSLSSWSLTLYLLDSSGVLYEMDGSGTETKPIEPRKRSTRDVRYLDSRLKQLDVKQAQDYLRSFH